MFRSISSASCNWAAARCSAVASWSLTALRISSSARCKALLARCIASAFCRVLCCCSCEFRPLPIWLLDREFCGEPEELICPDCDDEDCDDDEDCEDDEFGRPLCSCPLCCWPCEFCAICCICCRSSSASRRNCSCCQRCSNACWFWFCAASSCCLRARASSF